MDRDERMKILLEMQNHPEQFSEQSLEQMLNDTEAQELMEATAQLKRAMKHDEFNMSGKEIENEWQGFVSAQYTQQKSQYSWLKIAAMFAGVLFITALSYAAYHTFFVTNQTVQHTEETTFNSQLSNISSENDGFVLFAEIQLDSMLTVVGKHYGKVVFFGNKELKVLRIHTKWNPKDSLATFIENMNELDGLQLTEQHDTIYVQKGGEQ